jgi:hypothetical protein
VVSTDPSAYARHVCLAYDSRAELESRARDFLAEGAEAGELTSFVAAGAPAMALPWVTLGDTYADGAVIDPSAQVAAYAAATENALAAGWTGLRVVADATPLVVTPAQVDAFARYEYRIDRYMQGHPFAAMCAYDRGELEDDVIAQVACMHTESEAAVQFQLHSCPPGQGCAALTGELDLATDDLLTSALRRADLAPDGDEVVLHAGGLRFTDHRSLVRLQQYAEEHATTVVLRDAGPAVGRLADLMELPRLRVEVAR